MQIRKIIITEIVDAAGKTRTAVVSGLSGDVVNEQFAPEQYQHYGFASLPVDDQASGFMIGFGNTFFLIGDDDRRYRISLAKGEAALYDDQGQKVHIKRDGIYVSGKKVVANAPEVDITASSKVSISAPEVDLADAFYALVDERIIAQINEMSWNVQNAVPAGPGPVIAGPGPLEPIVQAHVTTAKTKAS